MRNSKNYIANLAVYVLLIMVVLSYGVMAFGVTSPSYSEAYPGEERTEYLFIGSDTDISVKAFLLDDAGIASFVNRNNDYTLPAGNVVKIPVKIKMPQGAAIGSSYTIKLRLTQSTEPTSGGTVGFAQDLGTSFVVRVVEKPATTGTNQISVKTANANLWWWILVVVIIVMLIAWWFLRKKKRNK